MVSPSVKSEPPEGSPGHTCTGVCDSEMPESIRWSYSRSPVDAPSDEVASHFVRAADVTKLRQAVLRKKLDPSLIPQFRPALLHRSG